MTLAEVIRPKAAANKRDAGKATGRGRKKVPPILAEPIDTREQAAKEAGVSHGSLSAWRYLKENMEPEEIGEQVGLSQQRTNEELLPLLEDLRKAVKVTFSEEGWSPTVYNVRTAPSVAR